MDDMQAIQGLGSEGEGPPPARPSSSERHLSRRRFVQGTAAAAGGIAAAGYVKPSLRSLGIPRALAVSGDPGFDDGTPGMWGNSGKWWPSGPQPLWVPDPTGFTQGSAYVGKWDASNDPDWNGVLAQPYAHGDLFNDFFYPSDALATTPMGSLNDEMLEILSGGGGSVWPAKTARQLIAAYLNASFFGSSYPYTQTELRNMWQDAITAFEQPAPGVLASTAKLETLQGMLDDANNGDPAKQPWP